MFETLHEGRGVFNMLLYTLRGKPQHLDRAIARLDRATAGPQPDPLVLAAGLPEVRLLVE